MTRDEYWQLLIEGKSLLIGGGIYCTMTYANGIDPGTVIEMPTTEGND